MACIFLAAVFHAAADEKLNPITTGLGSTTLGGYVLSDFSFNLGTAPARWTGISGQVMLVHESGVGGPVQSVPLKTTLSVYTQIGRRMLLIGNYRTTSDGYFGMMLWPGKYLIAPAAFTPYAGAGQIQVTVTSHNVTVEQMYIVLTAAGD